MFNPPPDSHFDLNSDADRDPDDGRGADRDDSPFASREEQEFMPMTRRDAPEYTPRSGDIDRLTNSTLRDTSAFLKKHGAKETQPRTTGQQAISIGEMFAGALLGGYLSQRFRATSGAIPTGLLLGGVGFGAAQFTQLFGSYSKDVKAVAIGSALASAVIWAAGYGSLGAEKSQAKSEGNFPVTGNAPPPLQMQPSQQQYSPQQQLAPSWPTPAYNPAFASTAVPDTPRSPAPQQPATLADFQNLVTRQVA